MLSVSPRTTCTVVGLPAPADSGVGAVAGAALAADSTGAGGFLLPWACLRAGAAGGVDDGAEATGAGIGVGAADAGVGGSAAGAAGGCALLPGAVIGAEAF